MQVLLNLLRSFSHVILSIRVGNERIRGDVSRVSTDSLSGTGASLAVRIVDLTFLAGSTLQCVDVKQVVLSPAADTLLSVEERPVFRTGLRVLGSSSLLLLLSDEILHILRVFTNQILNFRIDY